MSITNIRGSLLISDMTQHQARSAGVGGWVVSYLPGRTLTMVQARAALRAAEELTALRECAALLGLTALEAAGMAATDCPWPEPRRQWLGLRMLSRTRVDQ
ncbi:hypothetical protein NONI108955_21910 [Nocardia ninae]